MTDTAQPPVDDVAGEDDYTPPFLRITGTYPRPGDTYETVALEMHLGPGDALDEVGDGVGGSSTRSWFIEFCTATIAALRTRPQPQTIVLTGPGAQTLLADRVLHADDCDGSCGQPAADPAPQAEPAGAGQGGGA